MAIKTEIPVEIRSRNDHNLVPTQGLIVQMEWTPAERLRNALKTFGIMFGLACFAVLAPLIHYFLVPSLLIASFVLAFDKYGQLKFFVEGKGSCPKCGSSILFEKSKFKERLTDSCANCHDDVEILLTAKT